MEAEDKAKNSYFGSGQPSSVQQPLRPGLLQPQPRNLSACAVQLRVVQEHILLKEFISPLAISWIGGASGEVGGDIVLISLET